MLGVAGLTVVIGAGYVYWRPTQKRHAPASQPAPALQQVRVLLALDPADATVHIDQIPAIAEDLFLARGTSHVVQASAPGRITRRFSFQVKPGLELSVHLGRTLALPSASDPEPSPNEPLVRGNFEPATREEIARAFDKLERYAKCLAVLGAVEGEGRTEASAGVPNTGQMSACIRLLDQANGLEPAMPRLRAASQAYLRAAHTGKNPAILPSLLAAFSAEYLAVRAHWQIEELARQGAEEGQTAAWHMRRLALAAQSWLRQGTAPAASARARKDSLAKLEASYQAFLDYARQSTKEMARVVGADEFATAARALVAVARGDSGKRGAAYAACRKLIAAFNALVVG